MFCRNNPNHRQAQMLCGISRIVIAVILALSPQMSSAQAVDPFSPDKKAAGGEKPAGGVIASAEFVDTPVTTIFRMASDMTGWSIVMSPEVSKQPPKINIWIKNLTPEEVLEQVTVMAGLAMERKGQTVRVMTFDEYARTYGVVQRRIQIKNASARSIVNTLKPFAAKDDQSRILADEQSNSIVLLVPRPLIDSLAALAEALDVPYESDKIEVVALKYLRASDIVPELEKFLTSSQGSLSRSRVTPQSVSATANNATETVAGAEYVLKFMIEPKLNVIVLRGSANDVARATDLIAKLDVSNDITIATYEFRYVNAKDIFKTIQDIMEERSTSSFTSSGTTRDTDMRRFKLSLAEQTNRIVAEGSKEDHAKLAELVAAVDVPLPSGSGATRVYRLTNATAEEVAKVITGLIEDSNKDRVSRVETDKSSPGVEKVKSPGMGTSGSATPGSPQENSSGVSNAPGMTLAARVTPVPEINAVVIRASATEHEEFEHLIRELDKPRDQVILEVTVVTVRSDNSFALGLELGGAILDYGTKSIGFTAFGIGTPDPATGAIRIAQPPPLGMNFAIFSSDDFSLVLNALKTVGDVRVSEDPRSGQRRRDDQSAQPGTI